MRPPPLPALCLTGVLLPLALASCSSNTATTPSLQGPGDAPLCADDASWASGSFAALPEVTGDLVTFVDAQTAAHPQTFHTVAPGSPRDVAFGVFLDALLDAVDATRVDASSGDWCGVIAKGVAAGYGVSRFWDTTSQRYYLYAADLDAQFPGEQAFFFVNPVAGRNIVLESPHSYTDPYSEVGAAKMLTSDLTPRALVVSGAARCASTEASGCGGTTPQCNAAGTQEPFVASDTAHAEDTLFQAFHKRLSDRPAPSGRAGAGMVRFVQIHSSASELLFANGTDADPYPNAISTAMRDAVRARVSNPLQVHSCNAPPDGTAGDASIGDPNNRCAEWNSQARYTNDGSLVCSEKNATSTSVQRWFQIETDGSLWQTTTTGTGAPAGWWQVMDAVRDPTVWPECNLTCSPQGSTCLLGSPQPRVAQTGCGP